MADIIVTQIVDDFLQSTTPTGALAILGGVALSGFSDLEIKRDNSNIKMQSSTLILSSSTLSTFANNVVFGVDTTLILPNNTKTSNNSYTLTSQLTSLSAQLTLKANTVSPTFSTSATVSGSLNVSGAVNLYGFVLSREEVSFIDWVTFSRGARWVYGANEPRIESEAIPGTDDGKLYAVGPLYLRSETGIPYPYTIEVDGNSALSGSVLITNNLTVNGNTSSISYTENGTTLSALYANITDVVSISSKSGSTYTTLNAISGGLLTEPGYGGQGAINFTNVAGNTIVAEFGLNQTDSPIFSNIDISNRVVTQSLSAASLSATSISSASLSATEVISNFNVLNVTSNKTFTINDNSRIFSFDTSGGSLSAIFPAALADGFSVGITNTGTNTIYVSSTQVNSLCATSNKNSTIFSGIYIYKTNNKLFGIGKFN